MRANGKVTLIFVDERMTYYVKGTATETAPEGPGGAGGLGATAAMDVRVHSVLADSAGADEGGATITSGIVFEGRTP